MHTGTKIYILAIITLALIGGALHSTPIFESGCVAVLDGVLLSLGAWWGISYERERHLND